MSLIDDHAPVADAYVPSGRTTVLAVVGMLGTAVATSALLVLVLGWLYFPLDPNPTDIVTHAFRLIAEMPVFLLPAVAGFPASGVGTLLGNRNRQIDAFVAVAAPVGVYVKTECSKTHSRA